MSEKIYTIGQIAKRFKVPLKKVYNWRYLLHKGDLGRGRGGTVLIPKDPYGRYGFPENLVKHFPKIPSHSKITS